MNRGRTNNVSVISKHDIMSSYTRLTEVNIYWKKNREAFIVKAKDFLSYSRCLY